MTNPVQDDTSTPATPEEMAAAQCSLRRISEYNASIDLWVHRSNHAASMANETRRAKERFIKSIVPSPFWIPTLPR